MSQRVVRRIAFPMIGLGLFLAALGIAAAWNVHQQQQVSSDLIAKEVAGVIAIEELHLEMREIRYQVNLFLRTRNLSHLKEVAEIHLRADQLLAEAKSLARADQERDLILKVEAGYKEFFQDFRRLTEKLPVAAAGLTDAPQKCELPAELEVEYSRLSDKVLTDLVLVPLHECIVVNEQVVERTNQASQSTAQHLKIGFLLLGLCGGAAGLLMGNVIARAVGQQIVELDISVRGVAGRLPDLVGPVTFSKEGDLAGLEAGLRTVEQNIASMVERLQQQELEILRSEQLVRVGQLAAGLAHELRNPLMPMKMLVQSALERPDGAGLRGRSLQIIQDEISRLEGSIQAFLDFARPPDLVRNDVAIQEIVQRAVDLVAGRARTQFVELIQEYPNEPLMVYADRSQIHQLILNLLLNALDVLPDGGTIQIRAELETSEQPTVVPAVSSAPSIDFYDISEHQAMRILHPTVAEASPPRAQWVRVSVRDSGAGIPMEVFDKIFDPFFTTKETGTGLGLPVCHRIAKSHQGSLTAHNSPSGGAEFIILLPTALPTSAPQPDSSLQNRSHNPHHQHASTARHR